MSSKAERAQTAQQSAPQTIAEQESRRLAAGTASAPFALGTIVLVSLNSPREKFWGMILELAPAGASLRGIELNCFEDFSRQVKAGDAVTPNAVFFPMHRVERIEVDSRNGEVPSLQERFASKTGHQFHEVLRGGLRGDGGPAERAT